MKPGRSVPGWACLLIGAAAATVGLLPWLVTGLRIPLQNLWATEPLPEDMPLALLPFSQYAITTIIGLLVVGPALAGLAARVLGDRLPSHGVLLVAVGTVVVQAVAVAQTATVVGAGLREGVESLIYLAGLLAVSVLAALFGMLSLLLVSTGSRAGAVAGLGVGALALGPWLGALTVNLGLAGLSATVAGWVPPVLVGLAIAWGGLGTVGRLLAAAAGLVLVWLVPPLTTAIQAAFGSRVLLRQPAELVDQAVRVLVAASTMPELVVPPILTTLIVAGLGVLARRILLGSGGPALLDGPTVPH